MTQRMTTPRPRPVLIAVKDQVLHPEAKHVAAAAGHRVVDADTNEAIARHLPRAVAVFVDAEAAGLLAHHAASCPVYFLSPDPGPIEHDCAVAVKARRSFILPAQSTDLLKALSADTTASPHAPVSHATASRAVTIGMIGVTGGVGVSTLAAAVARTAAKDGHAVLVDAVENSGGIDLLFGAEDTPGARWADVDFKDGTVAAVDLLNALPATADGIALLSTIRSTIAEARLLTADDINGALLCLRALHATVIVDLPATEALGSTSLEALDLVVLVVAAEVRAGAAAARLTAHLRAKASPRWCCFATGDFLD